MWRTLMSSSRTRMVSVPPRGFLLFGFLYEGGGGANFRDVISERTLDLALVQKQIAVTENGGEKIVEIVGDPGGKLAERFHFLRAAELILQLFAGGDIHERTDQTLGCAVVGT